MAIVVALVSLGAISEACARRGWPMTKSASAISCPIAGSLSIFGAIGQGRSGLFRAEIRRI